MTDVDLIVAAIERLRADVEALPRRIAAEVGSDRRRPSLSEAEVERLSRQLPAIHSAWPDMVFVVRDLWDDEQPSETLTRVIGPRTEAKRLGKLLARAADCGQEVAGFSVQRAARLREGQAWTVRRSANAR